MAVLRSDANQAYISIVSKSFSQHLNSISREPSSITYVNNELVIAVKKNRDNEAALIGIDITTGHRIWSLPLEDDDVEVVPDADVGSLIINERRKKKIRRVSKSKCCNEGKSGDNDSKNPDNCYDGFSLLPFDCYDLLTRKNTIIKRHNRRCEPQSDCSAHLDWYIWDLKKAGNYAVAWSRGHRSMAIVDPNDMQIMHQQYFGDSPVVAAYARNSPRLIYFDFFTGTWNSINVNNLKSCN